MIQQVYKKHHNCLYYSQTWYALTAWHMCFASCSMVPFIDDIVFPHVVSVFNYGSVTTDMH